MHQLKEKMRVTIINVDKSHKHNVEIKKLSFTKIDK